MVSFTTPAQQVLVPNQFKGIAMNTTFSSA